MVSHLQKVKAKGLVNPPKWLPQNIHYEVMTGSQAYGMSTESSDMDVVGFVIPPKDLVFPHLAGEIPGFGRQLKRFEQYQQHHVMDGEQEYDFTFYSIVKFFHLAMENNPNMIDVLFVPQHCVLFASRIGQLVRDNRKMFLHKGSYQKCRGYSYAQLHKIGTKANSNNPERQANIDKFGMDLKFASHVVRLLLQCEQILVEGDLDLLRNKEVLKGVRRGDWSEAKLREWFTEKEKHLEELYTKSTLQHSPDEQKIKTLLMNCLEEHYGSLSDAVKVEVPVEALVRELQGVLDKWS